MFRSSDEAPGRQDAKPLSSIVRILAFLAFLAFSSSDRVGATIA